MNTPTVVPWPQPLDPLHSLAFSALAAAMPLIIVLFVMGALRRSGLLASTCGLAAAVLLALFVWHTPAAHVLSSTAYGMLYALWPILWIVFGALWLYNLSQDTGAFASLQRWMEQNASANPCIQAMLVAFSFGALMEGTAGFGAPVAITACLLLGLGFEARRAVLVALIANTAPVAFGALGIPIVALAGVTGLNLSQLSAMAGRQVPVLSAILPAYLAWVVGCGKGLKQSWPAALVAGGSFALVQFFVSNYWGPYVTDVISALISIAAMVAFLKFWTPSGENPKAGQTTTKLSSHEVWAAWLPWALLSAVMVLWSYLKLLQTGQRIIAVPALHNQILITLYHKLYAALYTFQPLGPGTGVIAATILTAVCLRVQPQVFFRSGGKALRQLRIPGLTVMVIVGLAYLYNYSGMAYTLGAAAAGIGPAFPFVSGYLGWIACFLSGSDTSANVLFGNLQVAVAHQLHLSPVLLAATNSSGAVAGKMISPQNIAIGVTTVGLIGREGQVLRSTFWHSVFFTALIGLVALAQAYWLTAMIP
jgi:lactate permease